MKKTILFLLSAFVSLVAEASLIKYEASNIVSNIESGEEFLAPMEVVFDIRSYSLVSLEMQFRDSFWSFKGSSPVTRFENQLEPGFFEVFAIFGPLDLVSERDIGKFFASEWKVHDSNRNVDVLSELGVKGPDALSSFVLGEEQYGITSKFESRTLVKVSEPSTLLLLIVFVFFIVSRRFYNKSGFIIYLMAAINKGYIFTRQ